MILSSIEPGKYLHVIDYFPLFLGLLSFLLLSLLEIEETSLQYELFSSETFIQTRIVELNHIIFQLYVLFCIIIKVLEVSEEGVSIAIIFLIEITSLGHVANNLM